MRHTEASTLNILEGAMPYLYLWSPWTSKHLKKKHSQKNDSSNKFILNIQHKFHSTNFYAQNFSDKISQ